MIPALIFAALLAHASAAAADAERRTMITSFDRIRVDGPFTVRVTTGRGAAASVVGDRRSLDTVQVRVDGTTLIVSPVRADRGQPVSGGGPVIVDLTTPSLAAASVRGAGSLRVDRMGGARIDLSLTGAGSITVDAVAAEQMNAVLIGSPRLTLTGKSIRARFLVNGSASVDAAGLRADTLIVRSEGAGEGRYSARFTADVTGLGSGTIDVAGGPRCTTRGTATIRCGE